jgi:hypothetical protein
MAARNWLYALRPEESNARVSLGTQVAKELRATYQLTPIADPNSFPWTKQQDVRGGILLRRRALHPAPQPLPTKRQPRHHGGVARAKTPHLVINMLVSSVTGHKL